MGVYWFSEGRTAPLGPSQDQPMNDDTDGHNKAITGVHRQCFVKEAGFPHGPFVVRLSRAAERLQFLPISALEPRP